MGMHMRVYALAVMMCGCVPIDDSRDDRGTAGGGVAPAATVMAVAETIPVESADDAADDPAIWVHPRDPALSVVIGTDKKRGLNVYDLEGRILQTLPDGRMNNVDLRDGVEIGGRKRALVAATNRSDRTIALYLLDSDSRRLEETGAPIRTGFQDPYGLCMYRTPDGEHFVFASDSGSGRFRQWQLTVQGDAIVAKRVREFPVGSQAEGCVADDETGALYVAEEGGGFWKYQARPEGGRERTRIDRVGGPNGLVADIEGVSIWSGSGGNGFLVLSNQGADAYAVYRREEPHEFVGLFRIVDHGARGVDGVSETDGLAVASAPLGPRYPDGLLVVQDDSNLPAGQSQNFKYVSWRDVVRALDIGG